MRKLRPPFRRVRKGRRYLPNTGTEDEEAAFDLPELEDWMTGAPGGK
jgi:hypothetical protein